MAASVQPGATRMCVLPFITPSVEPNGDVRLCSAASTYAYLHETNMGNVRDGGLAAVWTNERFRRVRAGLLTGEDLAPYCAACEYRSEGPPWVLQLHLALYAYNHSRAPHLVAAIERHAERYGEYRALAPGLGLWVEEFPADLRQGGAWRYAVDARHLPRQIVFRDPTEWADVVMPLPALELPSLAACTDGAVVLRHRCEPASALSAVNLRISLESDSGDMLYAFPELRAPDGELRTALPALRSDATIAPGHRAARLRVGGFAPSGTTVLLEAAEVVLGGDIFESALNPHLEETRRQAGELERLGHDAAALARERADLASQLAGLETWVDPIRRALAMVPGPLRRAGRRLLRAVS